MTTGFQVNGVDFDEAFINKAAFYNYSGLWATGDNTSYQLGNGTNINTSSPVQTVSGGLTWTKRFSSGYQFTHAIKTDGTLWVWGLNNYGQLGINSVTTATSPQVVGSVSNTNWSKVACGSNHTIASKTDGTLWAWGYNAYGQLGDNTIVNKSSPVQIGDNAGSNVSWLSLSAGENFSAGITSQGYLYTWGLNNYGQLGIGSTTNISTKTLIDSSNTWQQVSCGYAHTAAIKTDGTLWVWGYNTYGQLGTGDAFNFNRSSPVQTSSGSNAWKTVTCGFGHTAAIKTDGSLWAWGYNASGQLGTGDKVNRGDPVENITYGKNWKQLSAGANHTAAIKTDGTLWGWGLNVAGQLGDGISVSRSSPVLALGNEYSWTFVQMGQASESTFALAEGKW